MKNTFKSSVSEQEYPIQERIMGSSVRQPVFQLIQKDHPDFTKESCLSISELNNYRKKYITDSVSKQIGDVDELEKTVLKTMENQTTITDKIDDGDDDSVLTVGQRVADKVATFGGSWTFIITFLVFILLWIALNIFWLINQGFDPYPFILLNLMLSCLAALQAPVIMMSQNRQADKDRERVKKNYMVNLKSELEIKALHEKMDHLILRQQQDLMDIQQVQIEMLNNILDHTLKEKPTN